jgi:hypothetical protein
MNSLIEMLNRIGQPNKYKKETRMNGDRLQQRGSNVEDEVGQGKKRLLRTERSEW